MVQVGELQEALDAIKWGVDYLLNCHTEPMKFVAMYGSSEVSSATFKGVLLHPLDSCLSEASGVYR